MFLFVFCFFPQNPFSVQQFSIHFSKTNLNPFSQYFKTAIPHNFSIFLSKHIWAQNYLIIFKYPIKYILHLKVLLCLYLFYTGNIYLLIVYFCSIQRAKRSPRSLFRSMVLNTRDSTERHFDMFQNIVQKILSRLNVNHIIRQIKYVSKFHMRWDFAAISSVNYQQEGHWFEFRLSLDKHLSMLR